MSARLALAALAQAMGHELDNDSLIAVESHMYGKAFDDVDAARAAIRQVVFHRATAGVPWHHPECWCRQCLSQRAAAL